MFQQEKVIVLDEKLHEKKHLLHKRDHTERKIIVLLCRRHRYFLLLENCLLIMQIDIYH